MPLQATSGAASYDAFGGGVPVVPKYIEDYFSTYLVTGDGTAPAVNNGIDLSTKGGLVWTKKRSAAGSHSLFDTARGANLRLISNDTAAQDSVNLSFTTTGFSNYTFDSGVTYTSWSWAKAPKFFDVVTYTGNGSQPRTITHNLGSVPGCIIVKRTDTSSDWAVYHRAVDATNPDGYRLELNTTGERIATSTTWNDQAPTATEFYIGSATYNASGGTYVAYLFAHDAGGFGLTGTDNVISCGSFTGSASGTTVNLGWEPQWVLIKRSSGNTDNWRIYDNMRGMTASNGGQLLYADTSGSETTNSRISVNATGFGFVDDAAYGNIYIAIRRGPMKVPTSGTSVFSPVTYTGDNSNTRVISTGFPPDMVWTGAPASGGRRAGDRLRGLFTNPGPVNYTYSTSEETFDSYSLPQMSGWQTGNGTVRFENSTSVNYVLHAFKRAPSFFDVVCYTGTGSTRTIAHNLTVAPELMIVKCRSTARAWPVYAAPLGNTEEPRLNESSASGSSTSWNSTTPTSSVFSVSNGSIVNASGDTYVAYLFATCAGVSKVGSYTGTATTLQVDCGFTGGARFVLIKRTDSTGDWYVWDTARGIVSGNDSYLLLNSNAAEVTNTDYIDTYSAGFEISSTAPAAINASGGSFIFFAVA